MDLPVPKDSLAQLRVIEESDSAALFSLIDRNREHLRAWLPWLDDNTMITDTQTFIRHSKEQQLSNRGLQAGIWYHGELAGIVGYHPIDWLNRVAMIGYWLGREQQGKGLMTAACRSLVGYAFDEYELNRVEIRCATGNTKSCAIPERLGFTKEGIIREGEWLYDHFVDLVLYSMLARDWRKLRY